MDIRIGDRFEAKVNLDKVGDVWEITNHIRGNRWDVVRLSDGMEYDFHFGGSYRDHDRDWKYLVNFNKSSNYANLYDLLSDGLDVQPTTGSPTS